MGLPKNFPGEHTVIGIVVDRCGEDSDYGPDPTHAGNMRVAIPGQHDLDGGVEISHLSRSSKERGANADDQCTFPGQSDYGSVVYVSKETGRTDCIVRGSPNETYQTGGTPGNNNLLSGIIGELIKRTDGRQIPPDYQEVIEKGAKIRKVIEKGKEHSHDLLKGLPIHGALYNIAGQQLPPVKNIHTAIEKFSNILTSDQIGQLPGQMMSIGSMLKSMASNPSVTSSMPPQVNQALQSMATLAQSGSNHEEGGAITGMRVNPDVFLSNAANTFSQVQTVHDLVVATQTMIHDTTLHGMDRYANTEIVSTTPFGETTLTINANGDLSEVVPNEVANVSQQYGETAANPTQHAGSNSGQNMFGGSSGTMTKMFERLPQEAFQKAIDLSKKLNTEELAQKMKRMNVANLAQENNNFLNVLS